LSSVIDTPQHYIPLGGSSPSLNLSYIREVLGVNTSSTGSRAIGLSGSGGGGGVHSIPYPVIASIFVAIVVAIILYFIATRYSQVEGIVRARDVIGLAYSYTVPYSYSGRKLALRKLFDRVRGKLMGLPGFYEGLTIREIALSLDPSKKLKRFADIYNTAVFSPREPSEDEVREAESIVSAWENTTLAASDF